MSNSSSVSSSATSSSSAVSSSSSSGSNSNSPGISNSATLYLYTFLATLVLLLGVSGAIVIRSLILRRRHRRMIEEAIRNGTYIPPNVLANSRGRIDPAKKPKMWEATVGAFGAGAGEGKGKGGGMIEKESLNRWDDILPVSASISSMLPGTALSTAAVATGDNVNTNTENGTANADSSDDVVRSNIRTIIRVPARIAVGAFRLISPGNNPTNSSSSRAAAVDVESNPVAMSSFDPTSPNILTKRPHQVLPQPSASTPTHMQVAVLIAMPGALASIKSKSSSDGHGDEDEEEVPYVEVGTTEVVISPSGSSAGSQEELSSTSSGSSRSVERL